MDAKAFETANGVALIGGVGFSGIAIPVEHPDHDATVLGIMDRLAGPRRPRPAPISPEVKRERAVAEQGEAFVQMLEGRDPWSFMTWTPERARVLASGVLRGRGESVPASLIAQARALPVTA